MLRVLGLTNDMSHALQQNDHNIFCAMNILRSASAWVSYTYLTLFDTVWHYFPGLPNILRFASACGNNIGWHSFLGHEYYKDRSSKQEGWWLAQWIDDFLCWERDIHKNWWKKSMLRFHSRNVGVNYLANFISVA
jgi:hypothetical protein